MRKISLFISLILLFGCEKYELETYPKLSGQWKLTGIEITNAGSTIDGSYHILNDTVLLQQYKPININNNVITFSQDYNDPNTKWYDKFILNHTVWEFETNIVGIPIIDNSGKKGYLFKSYYFSNRDSYSKKYTSFTITEGNRHIGFDEYGLERIKLTLPRVWTMFKRNTNIEFFFQESITLTFRRI
jgi:hypothetical protein